MTPIEKKTLETFNLMWDTWEYPTTSSVRKSISTWDERCKGFGSGITEIWKSKADFRKYCEASFQQNPEGFKVTSKWIETDHLSENIVALWGEIIITVELPQKTIILNPVRVTGVFKKIGGDMKLIQWHASTPDISTDEELWEGTGKPKFYENVSVLFTDFIGFGKMVLNMTPHDLVEELNVIFAEFDAITRKNGLEKIKIIGDSYMAAAGLGKEEAHAVNAVKTAKEYLQFLHERNKKMSIKWNMRIGIHSGSVVGGTIGSEKLGFDLWGDTVNLASRFESSSEANRINISSDTFTLVKHVYDCEYRGKIKIKDQRQIEMYFIN
ncbi:MAG: nuclear transport factor 2 family protein [Saprospiraceae bacterium]|nr:nuclear transport factor 2 family protein [Saprospiraceae bacterium]